MVRAERHFPGVKFSKILNGVNNGNIVSRLVLKNPELGRAILAYRGIPIEMIGSKVQPDRHLRTKSANGLQLERADLSYQNIEFFSVTRYI